MKYVAVIILFYAVPFALTYVAVRAAIGVLTVWCRRLPR